MTIHFPQKILKIVGVAGAGVVTYYPSSYVLNGLR